MSVPIEIRDETVLKRARALASTLGSQLTVTSPPDGFGVWTFASATLDITRITFWLHGLEAPKGYGWVGDDKTKLVPATQAQQEEQAKQVQASDAQFSKLLSVFGGAVVSHAHLDALEKELHDFEENVDAPWPLHQEIAAFRQCSVYEAHLFIEQALAKYYTALHNVVAGMRSGQTPLEDLIAQQDLTPPQVQVAQGDDLAYYRPKYRALVAKATDDFWAQRLDGTIFGNMYALMSAQEAQDFIDAGYPSSSVPELVKTYATITGLSYNAAANQIVARRDQLIQLAAQVEPQRQQTLSAIDNAASKAEMSNAYRSYKTFLANLP